MDLQIIAKTYGCHDVIWLKKTSPDHLEYLDLQRQDTTLHVDGIAEFQSAPLLYLVSSTQNGHNVLKHISELQSLLANRGERSYIGILHPGELHVYPVNWPKLAQNIRQIIPHDAPEAPLFFQNLVHGAFTMEGLPDTSDYVFFTIYNLMAESSRHLIHKFNLYPLDVLSFLGRALFFRFLWDRNIIKADELSSIYSQASSLKDCFGDVASSVDTCRWLDETFNGDLLPFTDDYKVVFDRAHNQSKGKIFLHLQAILEGWEHVGSGRFQTRIDWGDLDFAHIPIGVLSQVYEKFSREWDPQSAQASVYYTPKTIARYLVDEAFEGVSDKRNATILDPSCGAGIFLVLAFRKLFEARWKQDGKRPDTDTIQSILYNQIRGFDISESALRLSALALYITAIELNGTPRPPKRLKFPKPLQNFVLFNQRRAQERQSTEFIPGSLNPDMPKEFNKSFDLVIGNPPWSRLRGKNEAEKKLNKKLSVYFTALSQNIIAERGFHELSGTYKNPDNNPDLPFVWKATQWAKPNGIIAMALPGRIFLKLTNAGTKSFHTLLQCLEITGILNGSNLSDTAVWAGMNQPFMLLFARNRIPEENHHFHFVTPYFEEKINDRGRIRIDFQAAQPIAIRAIIENETLLKTLSVGTILDVDVVRKISDLNWDSVKTFWDQRGLYCGRGYDISPGSKQKDAGFMLNLPDFIRPGDNTFFVDLSNFPKFKRPTAHMPRNERLYSPPILIVPESPGGTHNSSKSWIVREPTVFNKSFYGYSADQCEHSDWVISILHLLTHSQLFEYHVLMTSSRMGAERRTFLKESIDNFPFPPEEILTPKQKKHCKNLSHQLEVSQKKPWKEINDFIYTLYGLNVYDRQVIIDTLDVAAPFKDSRNRANKPPSNHERNAFYNELDRFLSPSFEITGEKVLIEELNLSDSPISAWSFFSIRSSRTSQNNNSVLIRKLIHEIIKQANNTGSSRIIVHDEGLLFIGIIGQYRYWTLSRARLTAQTILRYHLDAFPTGEMP